MKWTTEDPAGVLNAGTRWTIKYGTPHTVRVIHGLYQSDVREDDLIIWTIERHGVPQDRPFSGRRRSFHRWEPARMPVFELNHMYRHKEAGPTGQTSRFLIIHVMEKGDPFRVIALKNGDQVVDLFQPDRNQFEDVTGEDAVR